MTTRKIYVVGPSTNYAKWMEGTLVNSMAEADLVVFTGGEDVDPAMYGEEEVHPRTHFNTLRDGHENIAFDQAEMLGIPMIGICRGAQFLCMENGGVLIQDQPNPGPHKMFTYDGNEFTTSSMHHQAMFPFNLPDEDYRVIGWTKGLLAHHQNGKQEEMDPPVECEVVYFPVTKCLGIQGHPEMMAIDSPAVIYFRNLLTKFLDNTLENELYPTTKKEEGHRYHA